MVKMRNKREEETRICEDGEEVHVDVLLADAIRHRDRRLWNLSDAELACHRPGYRSMADVASNSTVRDAVRSARSARDRWLADLRDAWRGDARRKKPPDDDDDDDDENGGDDDDENNDRRSKSASDARMAAYDAYVARISSAWRMPPNKGTTVPFFRDEAQPDLGSPPDVMKRHLRGDEPPDREKMYAQRNADLENAWRNPPGVMTPQPALVGPGPSGLLAAASSADPRARAAAIEREGEKWRGGA
jgi:hypothetical protein